MLCPICQNHCFSYIEGEECEESFVFCTHKLHFVRFTFKCHHNDGPIYVTYDWINKLIYYKYSHTLDTWFVPPETWFVSWHNNLSFNEYKRIWDDDILNCSAVTVGLQILNNSYPEQTNELPNI